MSTTQERKELLTEIEKRLAPAAFCMKNCVQDSEYPPWHMKQDDLIRQCHTLGDADSVCDTEPIHFGDIYEWFDMFNPDMLKEALAKIPLYRVVNNSHSYSRSHMQEVCDEIFEELSPQECMDCSPRSRRWTAGEESDDFVGYECSGCMNPVLSETEKIRWFLKANPERVMNLLQQIVETEQEEFFNVHPDSLNASDYETAVRKERQRRLMMAETDWTYFDHVALGAMGFDFESTLNNPVPKLESFWCPICVGWYGMNHTSGKVLQRNWADQNDLQSMIVEQIVVTTSSPLMCDTDELTGVPLHPSTRESFIYGKFLCCCLRCSVADQLRET